MGEARRRKLAGEYPTPLDSERDPTGESVAIYIENDVGYYRVFVPIAATATPCLDDYRTQRDMMLADYERRVRASGIKEEVPINPAFLLDMMITARQFTWQTDVMAVWLVDEVLKETPLKMMDLATFRCKIAKNGNGLSLDSQYTNRHAVVYKRPSAVN
jgi:hypothetical protein